MLQTDIRTHVLRSDAKYVIYVVVTNLIDRPENMYKQQDAELLNLDLYERRNERKTRISSQIAY